MSPSMKGIMTSVPIIVCGKSPQIALGVKKGIQPVYETIHVVQSVEAGVRDIPSLLQGHAPPVLHSANLGTQEYGKKAAAVVMGGGYNDAHFEQLRQACAGKSRILWLRHDVSKDVYPRQPLPKIGAEYGEQIGKKIVDCLQDLTMRGEMDKEGVHWF
ncbi:hypothetical protein BO71DRAFT_485372 [Aspergillus ellipticus CBS 707.79]|uniref:Uncharacterized protein n=1 Tax=Aspergillus ellipticus CBS 707.79 TaxID=1448320 RepID=A0A319DDZ2_9EURO|nr:hypothetical protein BO71DRAFT_485372 [Aspergillus ellipticus CBS 707.79]